MDINNSKVNNLSNVFDKLIGKSNTYIPAMHKKTADTFVRTTKNVSFKGNVVTKEDVLSKLKGLDIPGDVKEKIEKQLGKQLETQGEIDIVNKFFSNPVLYGNETFQKSICSAFILLTILRCASTMQAKAPHKEASGSARLSQRAYRSHRRRQYRYPPHEPHQGR